MLLAQAQQDSFPDELKALKASRPIPADSRLVTLSPEYDEATRLLRVGGRLWHAEELEADAIHPIILDPAHQITRLLIQDFNHKLLHLGPERVLAEMQLQYWVLCGQEAIWRHQHNYRECQLWRAKLDVPKMAGCASTSHHSGLFWSIYCEKRWGIVYKCPTTRCIHLDLLEGLDTDAFLLSLCRFIARYTV